MVRYKSPVITWCERLSPRKQHLYGKQRFFCKARDLAAPKKSFALKTCLSNAERQKCDSGEKNPKKTPCRLTERNKDTKTEHETKQV